MNYHNEIKKELINNEVYRKVKDYSKNKNDLMTYYNVGKLLVEAQQGEARAKYGNKLIKRYSIKLTNEVDKKYSYRNLMNMRKFYVIFKYEIVNALRSQLTWTHYRELLVLDDMNKIYYYIKISVEQNLSYRLLHEKIKNQEYERLDTKTKEKLIKQEDNKIEDFIKNPILIKTHNNFQEITEIGLKQLIMEDIAGFLKELGNGFSFIDKEYKIKLGNRYNYIDLLLYNINFNCYVVIELKITELKKEHIGQIEAYMNYIDKNIKSDYQDKTIGIIICKKDNKFIMQYCSNENIFRSTYELFK